MLFLILHLLKLRVFSFKFLVNLLNNVLIPPTFRFIITIWDTFHILICYLIVIIKVIMMLFIIIIKYLILEFLFIFMMLFAAIMFIDRGLWCLLHRDLGQVIWFLRKHLIADAHFLFQYFLTYVLINMMSTIWGLKPLYLDLASLRLLLFHFFYNFFFLSSLLWKLLLLLLWLLWWLYSILF